MHPPVPLVRDRGTAMAAERGSVADFKWPVGIASDIPRYDLAEFKSLLNEVIGIIQQTGLRSGVSRTIDGTKAVSHVLKELFTDPTRFIEANGSNGAKSLSPPKILRRLFEELGASYIKIGQFIASSPTLFPANYVLEFQSCLDKSPTIPFADIRAIIESELGKPISALYAYVNPNPLASASIAQVHLARLKNGTIVVIKVQKPTAEATLRADLGFLLVASKLLEFINPSLVRLSLSNIVGDIRASMLDELDFRKEIENLLNFRAFLARSEINDAVAPFPYANFSSKRVLTMDYLKGVPLVDLEGIRRYSSNPEQTLITALKTWAKSVVENDIFHADVHGGNLLVLEDGKVGFIDFGIVGKISPVVWGALGDLVQCFVVEDYRGIAKALVDMGAAEVESVDIDKFGLQLEQVFSRIASMGPATLDSLDGAAANAQLLIDDETTLAVLEIVAVAEQNGLKLPREFGLLLKQALYFDRYQKVVPGSNLALCNKHVNFYT